MKFTKLKQSILKKKFHKNLLEEIKNRVVSQKEIQSVGILTTDKIASTVNVQEEVESILNVRNSKMYSFRDYNKSDEPSFKHFSEKDVNWKADFTEPSFRNFIAQPFDLLIGYFNTNNLYLEMAVLQSKATFKVGLSNVNSALYELEISEDITQVSAFCVELKKYLIILRKLKN